MVVRHQPRRTDGDSLSSPNIQIDVLIAVKLHSQLTRAGWNLNGVLVIVDHRVLLTVFRSTNGALLRDARRQRANVVASARRLNLISHRIERFQVVNGEGLALAAWNGRVHDADVLAGQLVILPVAGLPAIPAARVGPPGR